MPPLRLSPLAPGFPHTRECLPTCRAASHAASGFPPTSSPTASLPSLHGTFRRGSLIGMNRRPYLAAYDISSPRRLRAALYLLKEFASGCQKSVFECFLTDGERRELVKTMSKIINPAEDRFLLLPLAAADEIKTLGKGVAPVDHSYFYIG